MNYEDMPIVFQGGRLERGEIDENVFEEIANGKDKQ